MRARVSGLPMRTIMSAIPRPLAAPATGEYSEFHFEGRPMRLYRIPSSRAYPLPLEQKAAAYRRLFTALNMV